MRLGGILRRGVDPHFGAESRFGGGEIEVIDRRIFNREGIARLIDLQRNRPDDILPLSDVNIRVNHNNVFNIKKLF